MGREENSQVRIEDKKESGRLARRESSTRGVSRKRIDGYQNETKHRAKKRMGEKVWSVLVIERLRE